MPGGLWPARRDRWVLASPAPVTVLLRMTTLAKAERNARCP
jgi:hypothetical protein